MQRLKAASCVLLLLAVAGARAHTSENLVPLQLVVTSWAAAIQGDNLEAVAATLSDRFAHLGRTKQGYIAALPLQPVSQVVLRYADYQIHGTEATVSPVVVYIYREMKTPSALSLSLRKEEGSWKIVSISPSADLPDELIERNLPLQQVLHEVQVSVRDKTTGAPIHARIHVRDHNDDYWPPQGHRKSIAKGWREDIGGDVIVGGKTFAYVKPEFTLPLPAGKYVLEIARGLEYAPHTLQFEVSAANVPRLRIELERWIHMASKGWYSGDSHTHFLDPQTALLEAQGEDLNVINVLASSGGNLITSVNHFTGAPSVYSSDENIVYIGEETRHDYLGHTVLLNLKDLIYPFGWGEPLTGVHGGYDYPPMAHQADKAHAQDALVIWSHLPHPYAELPIDVALNKIDAVEAMVFGSPFEKHPVRVDLAELTPAAVTPLKLWYGLLNTGFNLPALGATDKMWNSQVSGAVRTYVKVDGKFSYQSWIDGIKAGRTFLSTAPMLTLSVGAKQVGDTLTMSKPGKTTFHAEVESLLPIDRVEIVVNGEVVASKDNSAGQSRVVVDGDIEIRGSAWIAARAYSAKRLPVQDQLTGAGSPVFAHTSPIYVEVGGEPRRSAADAAFLAGIVDETILWAKTKARYHNEEQRREVVTLYERAKAFYLEQAKDGGRR